MEGVSNFFHSVSRTTLTIYSDSRGGLINFDSAVASFELLGYSDRIQTSVSDRSVLLSFSTPQISGIELLQGVVTFESGLAGYISIPLDFRAFTSYLYDISASAVNTLNFPNSDILAVDGTFSLTIQRQPSTSDWQQQFTCRYIGGDVSIDLIQSIPAEDSCRFDFDELPSVSGRIELYNNDVLAWSFAVEFT